MSLAGMVLSRHACRPIRQQIGQFLPHTGPSNYRKILSGNKSGKRCRILTRTSRARAFSTDNRFPGIPVKGAG